MRRLLTFLLFCLLATPASAAVVLRDLDGLGEVLADGTFVFVSRDLVLERVAIDGRRTVVTPLLPECNGSVSEYTSERAAFAASATTTAAHHDCFQRYAGLFTTVVSSRDGKLGGCTQHRPAVDGTVVVWLRGTCVTDVSFDAHNGVTDDDLTLMLPGREVAVPSLPGGEGVDLRAAAGRVLVRRGDHFLLVATAAGQRVRDVPPIGPVAGVALGADGTIAVLRAAHGPGCPGDLFVLRLEDPVWRELARCVNRIADDTRGDAIVGATGGEIRAFPITGAGPAMLVRLPHGVGVHGLAASPERVAALVDGCAGSVLLVQPARASAAPRISGACPMRLTTRRIPARTDYVAVAYRCPDGCRIARVVMRAADGRVLGRTTAQGIARRAEGGFFFRDGLRAGRAVRLTATWTDLDGRRRSTTRRLRVR